MDLNLILPKLLGTAWLLPLASFVLIVFFGRRMGHGGKGAGYLATAAIVSSFVLSLSALFCWLHVHPLAVSREEAIAVNGDWYTLGTFGSLSLTVGYYIDSLTLAMYCMVTLIASCIHVYSMGYMHEELHEVTDPLARLSSGEPLVRRGRYYRFFQFLSLFCFSMLGLVISGNLAMVFAFWELVGICSYLLIGFYIERKSASNAANKAFIVNRVGDFGMIIGLMAIFAGMGTFSFGGPNGIFSQVRPAENVIELSAGKLAGENHEEARLEHAPKVPDGMVIAANAATCEKYWRAAAELRNDLEGIAPTHSGTPLENKASGDRSNVKPSDSTAIGLLGAATVDHWRSQGYGYWLLVVAGLGIFCGCVGKSAQFPLHVWLPDAMEGPTPVSALIHAATMVAAGVYLVGRCYPIFTPEVLMTIACVGGITLFIAATIAITATDIKRVLAYSTVSQLGYMMLALGVGGWLAGMFHLFTHAFFKALLFLCSGSVIHACTTNEMPQMGGLWRKMPWTAGTMLIGCLAIAGAGIPLLIGLSGYYSKDFILAQALSFAQANPRHSYFFWVAAVGAAITAFYMFRLWYMTFAGQPRDRHLYDHAHESPRTMVAPLVILAFFAVVAGWGTSPGLLPRLLEQSRPLGTEEGASAGWASPVVNYPAEEESHTNHTIHVTATLWAFGAALSGFLLATVFYGLRALNPEEARRQFARLHRFLVHKWWFDELYAFLFVRPALVVSGWVAAADKKGIDGVVEWAARGVGRIAKLDDWIDRIFVDGLVNLTARWTHAAGLWLRNLQTGNLRQYVMLIAVGTVALFLLASFYWNWQ